MIFASVFALIVGLAMIGQWSMLFASRQVPELQDEPIRLGFHLAGEFLTAFSLIGAAGALLAGLAWSLPLYLVAIGMLLYTTIVSPGYFAQQGNWKWLTIFAAIIAGAVVSLVLVVNEATK